MRAIDADALWMDIIHSMDYCDDILEIIEAQPTIEERKTGEWITNLYAFGEDRYECDQCHNTALHCYDFCPNCGAKMEGTECV